MEPLWIDDSELLRLVHGGAVLGGGGGGSIAEGLAAGWRAVAGGCPRIMELDAIAPDSIVVTLSRVGPIVADEPRGTDDGLRALRLFREAFPGEVAGFVPSEVGPGAVTYGLAESSATGLPVIDAPCNGRAHPTGVMGSLGLDADPAYSTVTVAVGGSLGSPGIEVTARGDLSLAAQLVRESAARLGRPVTVVRNPVPASYLRQHAAVGALAMARKVGGALLRSLPSGVAAVMDAIAELLGGQAHGCGPVQEIDLADRGGYTVGRLRVALTPRRVLTVPVCNEYMMVFDPEGRLASFPDLIVLFDAETALPLGSRSLRTGQEVGVLTVPRSRLILGSPMRNPALLHPVEALIGYQL
ncbi:MAG TPA: DUF917 family protein [Bacillota bacterium]|nr:DUF917 family protein [Bacillota bacterium]